MFARGSLTKIELFLLQEYRLLNRGIRYVKVR